MPGNAGRSLLGEGDRRGRLGEGVCGEGTARAVRKAGARICHKRLVLKAFEQEPVERAK